jgi:hypothetical protein
MKKLKATHQGELDLNGFILTCAVLNDNERTRVFSERNIALAFGIKGGGQYWKKKKSGGAVLPEYMSAFYLQPFISNELREKFNSAVSYDSLAGVASTGVDVTVLPDICDVYIQAKQSGIKNQNLQDAADVAYSMIKSFAKVGIIALVDEATGFQDDRDKKALQAFFQKFFSEEQEKLAWVKTFPDSFFEAIFKMKGWNWNLATKGKKPQVLGHYINDYVYSRLAPHILSELRVLNPKNEKGNRKGKYPQWISVDYGHPMLKEHLAILTAFAVASGHNWNNWRRLVERAKPKYNQDGSQDTELPLDFQE